MIGEPHSASRRKWLASAGVLAATILVGGTGEANEKQPEAAAEPTPPPPTPTPTPAKPKPAVTAGHVRAQAKPAFTLADYRKLVPGPAYPSHAIALTIDDGPHPVWTPKILALLERYHVQATFCQIGNQVLGHESIARSVIHAGHHLANHTWSHPTTLPKLSAAQMRREIDKAQDKIYSTTSYTPTLFRPPGGAWSAPLSQQVAAFGMTTIDWTTDPKDWQRPGTATIVRRLLGAKSGQILLCHDGGGDRSQTYAALKQVIPALLARGHTFVAL